MNRHIPSHSHSLLVVVNRFVVVQHVAACGPKVDLAPQPSAFAARAVRRVALVIARVDRALHSGSHEWALHDRAGLGRLQATPSSAHAGNHNSGCAGCGTDLGMALDQLIAIR